MQYFQAVQQGKQRASKSQMKMFEVAGFGMLTLTTKKIDGKFFPVGEEEFTAVINSEEDYVAVIVDKDGYTKARSKSVDKEEAISIVAERSFIFKTEISSNSTVTNLIVEVFSTVLSLPGVATSISGPIITIAPNIPTIPKTAAKTKILVFKLT